MIATASTAMEAAARFLHKQGYEVVYLGDDLSDEAQALGRAHARLAKEQRASGKRVAILSGGETRVFIGDAGGKGGRNTEYLASLARELAGEPGVVALAADTDGIDGVGDHAGALIVAEELRDDAAQASSLAQALAQHDTYSYFDSRGLLLRTGPTRTNVNDFRLILCHPQTAEIIRRA
jgi:hydroxypyruvate reductase